MSCVMWCIGVIVVFCFFKQKTAYEMRISDWSSDVCSSDLAAGDARRGDYLTWLAWYTAEMEPAMFAAMGRERTGSPHKQRNYEAVVHRLEAEIGRPSCRERVLQYV